MISPEWPGSRIATGVLLALVLALLVVNALVKDRRAFARFAGLTSSSDRRRVMRRWLVQSLALFGGLSLVTIVLDWRFAPLLLSDVWSVPWVAGLRATSPVVVGSAIGAFVLVLVVLTVLGIRAARHEGDGEVPTVGDVQALLPRNRSELPWGALLSVNAGVVEELLFRLSLPALVYGVSRDALVAVVASVLVFGALHAYQGIAGVLGTIVIGSVFMAAYLATGSIVVTILLHAVFDLRSLVLIPVAVMRVHTVRAED